MLPAVPARRCRSPSRRTDTTDYTTASATVTMNVAQATPTVVSVNPVNITYGTALANGQLSGTAVWTVNGSPITVAGTFTYTRPPAPC